MKDAEMKNISEIIDSFLKFLTDMFDIIKGLFNK